MSRTITVAFSAIGGSAAGLGRTDSGHTLIADRPSGVARGSGLGCNGGELLAAALGGCFWNDLHYAAERAGAAVSVDTVEARIDLTGAPARVVAAHISAALSGDPQAVERVFADACVDSTIANSLKPALTISFERLRR